VSAVAGRSVLVVEDEPFLRRLVVSLLGREGFAVQAVGSGAEALRTAGEGGFDLVLLDVGLPDMSGLDVLAALHRLPVCPRVVVITADRAPETLLRAIREQAYLYVRKPFEPAELLDAVRTALEAPAVSPIEVVSARPEWVELRVPCTREAAERIQSFMRRMELPLSDEARDSLGDAFRELLLNAVEWGGRLDPTRRVQISCLRTPRMLLYRIADPGPGFRFDALAHAATSNPPEDPLQHLKVREERGLRPGGLGIVMVRAIADELVYNEAQNEVVLVKYLAPERG
jgi:CheY-like chemotaxis protein/anti-sigma regulatory factor (Ser/Thr protein kinase)